MVELFPDRLCYQGGDPGIIQPSRSETATLQRSIYPNESVAGRRVVGILFNGREGSPKPPGKEQVYPIWLKMREPSSIFKHAKWQAKPPAPPPLSECVQ